MTPSPYIAPGLKTTPQAIMQSVTTCYGFTAKELKSKCRKSDLAEARQVVMELCIEIGMSLTDSGKLVMRDHATAWYSRKKVALMLDYDEHFAERYGKVRKMLKLD